MAKANDNSTTPAEPVELASLISRPEQGMPVETPADILQSSTDPIFAAIEKHRSAHLAFHSAYRDESDVPPQIVDEETRSLLQLLDTTPTTLRGAAAALRYIEAYLAADDDLDLPFQNSPPLAKPGSTILSRIAAVVDTAQMPAGGENDLTRQDADAHLILLGREFDRLQVLHEAAQARLHPLQEEANRRMNQWRSEHPGKRSPKAVEDAYSRVHEEIGLTAIEERGEHTDDIANQMDPIARAIMAAPATSIAGLAVKARVARFNAGDYWDEQDDDCDWDKLCIRTLVDAVLLAAHTSEGPVGAVSAPPSHKREFDNAISMLKQFGEIETLIGLYNSIDLAASVMPAQEHRIAHDIGNVLFDDTYEVLKERAWAIADLLKDMPQTVGNPQARHIVEGVAVERGER